MAKSPEEMTASMIANLADKTGKSLDEWVKVVQKTKLTKHGEIVKHLKSEHGVTHGYANLIAMKSLEVDAPPAEGDDLVAAQYSGGKAELRPIYAAFIKAIMQFGGDVEIAPKKAYVSLRRSKQFAIIQPSTSTRVDVGINLKDAPATARLEVSGSFNAMVSHRVRVTNANEVDAELIAWLKQAYAKS